MTTPNIQNTFSPRDVKAIMTEHPKTVLIDLLPPDHFLNVHVPGAKNGCVLRIFFE